jgi:hypothetical protein
MGLPDPRFILGTIQIPTGLFVRVNACGKDDRRLRLVRARQLVHDYRDVWRNERGYGVERQEAELDVRAKAPLFDHQILITDKRGSLVVPRLP